jgi:DNA-binding NtrC family response regulator
VRELENVIERAAILSTTGEIAEDDIASSSVDGIATHAAGAASPADAESSATLREVERQQIVRALLEAQGNRSHAARALGIERKTLYKKAQRLGIDLNAPGR